MADAATEKLYLYNPTVPSMKTEPLKRDSEGSVVIDSASEQQNVIADYLKGLWKKIENGIRPKEIPLKDKKGKRLRYKIISDAPFVGGMSDIYLAQDVASQGKPNPDNIVVIKTPSEKIISDKEDGAIAQESFVAEAQIMSVVNQNSHTLPILDFGFAVFPESKPWSKKEKPFYVTKYFPADRAESLNKMIERGEKLSIDDCVKMVTDIGSVIDDFGPKNAIDPNIKEELEDILKQHASYTPSDKTAPGDYIAIHNDIKPSNILKDKHYGYVLSDFGVFSGWPKAEELQQHVVGTPTYMAPEMFVDNYVDSRSDIYGLGVTLFEMLTGELPFKEIEGDLGATLTNIILNSYDKQPIINLYPNNPYAQNLLFEFFDRVLSKRMNERPQSGKEMTDTFKKLAEEIKISEEINKQVLKEETPKERFERIRKAMEERKK